MNHQTRAAIGGVRFARLGFIEEGFEERQVRMMYLIVALLATLICLNMHTATSSNVAALSESEDRILEVGHARSLEEDEDTERELQSGFFSYGYGSYESPYGFYGSYGGPYGGYGYYDRPYYGYYDRPYYGYYGRRGWRGGRRGKGWGKSWGKGQYRR
jgi:hypothetical protein